MTYLRVIPGIHSAYKKHLSPDYGSITERCGELVKALARRTWQEELRAPIHRYRNRNGKTDISEHKGQGELKPHPIGITGT